MKAWLSYAGWTALVVLGVVVVVGSLAPPASTSVVWVAGASAYAAQLIAFAALILVRRRPGRFVAGWAGGIALRVLTVGGLAVWVLPGEGAAVALLSLVGLLFVLMLMEPVFLRIAE